MRFDDIPAPKLTVRVKPQYSSDKFPKAKEIHVSAVKLTDNRGEFQLIIGNDFISVEPCNKADINKLSDTLMMHKAILARLIAPADDGSMDLQIAYFFGERIQMDSIDVGIDEEVQNTLNSKAQKILNNSCILTHGGSKYYFIIAGAAAKEYLEEPAQEASTTDDNQENQASDSNKSPSDNNRHFAVLGSDWRFALSEKVIDSEKTIFFVSKLRRTSYVKEDQAVRLVSGDLSFVDWTAAGGRADYAKFLLDKIVEDYGGYLATWDKYGDYEGELFLEKARSLGKIPFEIGVDTRDDGIFLNLSGEITDTQKEILDSGVALDVVSEADLPEFLDNKDITFQKYAEIIKEEEKDGTIQVIDDYKFIPDGKELNIHNSDNSDDIRLPNEGYLTYSVTGTVTQIRRRMDARERIVTGRSANPYLGLLIEEKGVIPQSKEKRPRIEPLSNFVMQRIFPKNPPTDKQKEAIDVALNTPDIALIQGPPGTGKTTVIAAIVERLNEGADKRSNMGKVLLSGFQHDAVENIINRLNINGLPVPKFGKRRGDDNNLYERQIDEWAKKCADKLEAKNPKILEVLEEKTLREMCAAYIEAPSNEYAIQLLETALKIQYLGLPLRDALQKELNSLKSQQSAYDSSQPILDIIRNLRITDAGFADDGSQRASDVLFKLENKLDDEHKQLLRKALRWNKTDTPDFLPELEKLREELFNRFLPPPVYQKEKHRDSVIKLIEATMDYVRRYGLSNKDKKTNALAELLLNLKYSPTVRDDVKNYSFAFAATCQQSIGKDIVRIKSGNYDYVIIDEAARVSPRDLMIPMTQGKRVILVGDHRQLPQIIDEEVARKLEEKSEQSGDSSAELQTEWLKKSMFEYMFTERLKKLEEQDGIKRRVTLDKQYRTHPLLGNFVSKNFYERFNPEEKFESPRGAEEFSHNLPDTKGKCAIWLNVSKERGGMKRSGTSWTRPVEADVIYEKLKQWADFEKTSGEQLSYGIISFYKAQTELIKKKIEDNAINIDEGRLRVGTVDSFQGMEFDVVFLSLVRTGVKGFGFLEMYNRLNVSMSRQKRLLVAVGDSEFYTTPQAEEKVPALYNFYNLCKEHGEII